MRDAQRTAVQGKSPPKKRTKVFLWTRAENGEYRQESFYQAENWRHLEVYGKNQKVYDAFSNEWDCCYEFGPVSDEDVDDDDDDADDFSMPPLPSDLGDPVADPLVPITSQSVPVMDRSFTIARPAQIPAIFHQCKQACPPFDSHWTHEE